jgi:hypothetical protein
MSRDQRCEGVRPKHAHWVGAKCPQCPHLLADNWALLLAQEKAITLGIPLVVVFNLVPKFLDATERHFGFMLKGLREVDEVCRQHNNTLV